MISAFVWERFVIFALGLAGYLIARHIHNKKTAKQPVVCPLRMRCHAVIHSKYSRFMGVPLEVFGMIYYLLVTLSYGVLLFSMAVIPFTFFSILVLFSLGAFIFSVYLVIVQIFILKEGCFWCFLSAIISILIFAITAYSYDVWGIVASLLK
jgi:uncharacterized membrane protein